MICKFLLDTSIILDTKQTQQVANHSKGHLFSILGHFGRKGTWQLSINDTKLKKHFLKFQVSCPF